MVLMVPAVLVVVVIVTQLVRTVIPAQEDQPKLLMTLQEGFVILRLNLPFFI